MSEVAYLKVQLSELRAEARRRDIYMRCERCHEDTHVNALDDELKCPTCHNGEVINEMDWKYED